VDFSKDSVTEAVFDLTDGKGAHVIFDAAGKPESINTALASARRGARLVIIGIPSQQQVGVNLWQAMHQEVTISVQKRSNCNDHDALEMIRRKMINPGSIVSHRFPLSDGAKAFEIMAEYADGVVKPVVEL